MDKSTASGIPYNELHLLTKGEAFDLAKDTAKKHVEQGKLTNEQYWAISCRGKLLDDPGKKDASRTVEYSSLDSLLAALRWSIALSALWTK